MTPDPLLEPISADAPCGVDVSYDPVYSDLAVLIEGTPENQFEPGSAKDPNWPAIRKLSEESLKKSKDLQIAIYFTVALMQITGMEGAARGMELIAGTTRKYWDELFPQLDPDDKDPTQRVNILSQMTVASGGYGDPIKFIDRFNAAPIFRVPGLTVTIAFLTQESKPGAGTGAAKLPEIIAGAPPEEVAAGTDALRRVAAAVHAIDDFLIQTLGRERAPSFDPLIKAVDKGLRIFDGVRAAVPAGAAAAATADGQTAGAPPKPGISGEIQSHEDVRRMLRKIREFYAATEPASPVPLLLERAERLVGRDWLDLLSNLVPTAKPVMDVLLGPTAEQEEAARKAAQKK